MSDEEVADTIAKKLWILTLVERDGEVLLDCFFAREEFLSDEIYCFRRRLNANCPPHQLVDCS